MNEDKFYIIYKKDGQTFRFETSDYGDLFCKYDILDQDPEVEIIEVENGWPCEEELPNPTLEYYSMRHWVY